MKNTSTDAAGPEETARLDGARIVVLAGGISHERDVSLRSGRRVADALRRHGARVDLMDPGQRLLGDLRSDRPDAVWPLLHGAGGEDGALYGLLRAARIPYVGARPTAARLAWNKATAKALVKRAGMATPPGIVLPSTMFRELGAQNVIASIREGIELPAVVKPVEGGSAQGVSHVTSEDAFAQALVTAFSYANTAIIERHVRGREVMVGIFDVGEGPVVTPPVEVVPSSGVFDYGARYNAGETTYFTPARIDAEAIERVQRMALRAYETIGLADLARVDMIVDEHGEPWFIEADPIPGLTETSIVPLALGAAGIEPANAYALLAAHAITRGPRGVDHLS